MQTAKGGTGQGRITRVGEQRRVEIAGGRAEKDLTAVITKKRLRVLGVSDETKVSPSDEEEGGQRRVSRREGEGNNACLAGGGRQLAKGRNR